MTEAIEPIAFIEHRDNDYARIVRLKDVSYLPHGTKLYAHPTPPLSGSAAEALEKVTDGLLLATSYIEYIKNNNHSLHREADGSPSVERIIWSAINHLPTLSAALAKEPVDDDKAQQAFEKWFFEERKRLKERHIIVDDNDAHSMWMGWQAAMTLGIRSKGVDVEQCAKALHAAIAKRRHHVATWDNTYTDIQEEFKEQAKAVLDAAGVPYTEAAVAKEPEHSVGRFVDVDVFTKQGAAPRCTCHNARRTLQRHCPVHDAPAGEKK